ncbi:hypothetical protein CWATWH0402_569 [Crocosphaera watsonii WH 0402]|uniref:Uncharacterized protein n=2 Tax=Crocosphaera watsonii TaxID=263511 RepID=T2JHZ0_CROWT|nr:hypothetical protein CWATWH0005_5427 [Crocosphaera watsonii WH 0005]CCQ64684.1 hypothetical protein CWATWH0402_569 [Crocosphaera watsonii WH 0402]
MNNLSFTNVTLSCLPSNQFQDKAKTGLNSHSINALRGFIG